MKEQKYKCPSCGFPLRMDSKMYMLFCDKCDTHYVHDLIICPVCLSQMESGKSPNYPFHRKYTICWNCVSIYQITLCPYCRNNLCRHSLPEIACSGLAINDVNIYDPCNVRNSTIYFSPCKLEWKGMPKFLSASCYRFSLSGKELSKDEIKSEVRNVRKTGKWADGLEITLNIHGKR